LFLNQFFIITYIQTKDEKFVKLFIMLNVLYIHQLPKLDYIKFKIQL